jgi:hypothetical protein
MVEERWLLKRLQEDSYGRENFPARLAASGGEKLARNESFRVSGATAFMDGRPSDAAPGETMNG